MQHFFIHHIQTHVWTRAYQQWVLFAEIRSYYIGVAIYFTEGEDVPLQSSSRSKDLGEHRLKDLSRRNTLPVRAAAFRR